MICKKCSTENPEEAVFCQHCGKRLDGKVTCPACGTMNGDEANFCIQCGKKLNNKLICPECNTEYEGNFCPKCGAGSPKEEKTGAVRAASERTAAPANIGWRKIVEYVAGGLCMAAVFFALLFAFLIGVTAGDFSLASTQAATIKTTVSIYDYFGAAYTDAIDMIGTANFDASALFTIFYPVVAGTLIVAATLVTVLTLSILSVVRYVKFLLGKSEKDYAKLSAGTVIAFLTGAVAFLALNAVSSGASSSGIGASAAAGFTPATTAGIALSCVFLALFAGCRIAIHAKEIFLQKRLVTLILSGVGVVLFSIALHFTGVGIAKASYSPTGYDSVAFKFSGGYPVIASICFMNVQQSLTASGSIYFLPDEFVIPSILSFIGLVIQMLLLTLLAFAIVNFFSNLTTKAEKGNLKFSITAAVFAIVHLVLAILSCVFLIEAHDNLLGVSVSYAYPIVALVFSFLSLGVAIAHKVLLKKPQTMLKPEQRAPKETAATIEFDGISHY